MPTIDRAFNGKMDLDTQPYRIAKPDYSYALNMTKDAQGESRDYVTSNIVGNQSVSYSLPAGTNKTIGNYPDKLRNRLYEFVWNSNGNHSILYYDKNTDVIIKVLQSETDSGGTDILGFNPSYKINHVDIIYNDEDGDLLFWTDGLNPPSVINVELAVSGGYGTFQRSFINVIKNPPQIPAAVTYEDDNLITVNNLRKKLFRCKYRFVYVNGEKSVWSAISELPLPIDYQDSAVDKDPTKNARIATVVQTGAADVVKIEIAFQQSLGSAFSDFFLVKVVDKTTEGVADNDLYIYRFYNNEAYVYVDLKESLLAFDWVPQTAYTQANPNGNVICYAAITEGYNITTVSGTAATASIPEQTTQLPFIFLASQSGNSGFGTGDINIVLIGSVATGDVFNVYTTNFTVTYTATPGDTVSDVLQGLEADAISKGFLSIFISSDNLIIDQSPESLQRVGVTATLRQPTDSPAWDYKSRYSMAIEYLDAEGRTIGALTTSEFTVQTPNYSETLTVQNIPQLTLSITNRPPIYAYYYHILFSKNLTKSKWLYWVSDRTYKDSEFAYIGIENLTTFQTENPSTPLGYDFLAGDRITFVKCLSDNPQTIFTNNDFEIVAEINNPVINGITYEGRYLKIALPTTSATFDFGTSDFFNYFIQLYTPAQSVANGLDVYYEKSERYVIGNPGTANAFHQGMLQNQTANLSQPATFSFSKGDAYYRERTIKTGGELEYTLFSGERGAGRHTMGVTFEDRSFTDSTVLTGNSPLQNLDGWTFASSSRAIILLTVGANTTTFRARGTISVDFLYPDTFSWFFWDSVGNVTYAVTPRSIPDTPQVFSFDCTFTLLAGQHISFVGWSENDFSDSKQYSQTDMTITIENPYTVGVVDQNFSDFFASAVNSYGRPWTVDPNAAQTSYPTLIRFGQEYQQDTSINNINRFYFENQDTYDRSFGSVKKLFIDKRYLFVFQEFDVGVVPVLTQIVKDTAGNPLEANSDILLNKISYPYVGKFGIGNVPESFAYGKWAKYFVDNNKGVVLRLSQDGITVLSVLYKANSFFVEKLAAYNTNLNNGIAPSGGVYPGNPTVYGVFDAYTNKYIIALEEINRYSDPNTLEFHQDPYTLSFLETRDESEGWESFLSYHPENMGCLDNLLVTFKNAVTWKHDSATFNNFYGVQYNSEITGIFNDFSIQKKTWISLLQMANTKWECPEIQSQANSYGTTQQQSSLIEEDFEEFEGQYSANFLRDSNSQGGILNGDFLKGNYLIVKLRKEDASTFVFLNGVSIMFNNSQLNKQ